MSNLSRMLKLYISVNEIEQKALARDLGMSESSLTRLLQGNGVDMDTFARIIGWLTEEAK